MSAVTGEYVQRSADSGWLVAGSRVSLDSIIAAYWDGKSPEAVVEEFPALTAEQVYGAIAFYLHHKSEIDLHLAHQAARWKELQQSSEMQHGPLLNRLRAQRQADAD
jgi:hypothetical protein